MRLPILHFLPVLAAAAVSAPLALAGPYPPAVGEEGSTAIAGNDPAIRAWATGYVEETFRRGPMSAADDELDDVSFGEPAEAFGAANVDAAKDQTYRVVSLGDGGTITLTFQQPITDGPGFDFAVFENGFSDVYLELAFVEVSSDGEFFSRFPAISLTSTAGFVEDSDVDDFFLLDPTDLHNLAGKYRGGYGTPFDLAELPADARVDKSRITHVRVIDVVGSVNPEFGSYDSEGRLIKDPFPTRFRTGGFDLDAIGVIHQVPEPSVGLGLGLALALAGLRRARPGKRL